MPIDNLLSSRRPQPNDTVGALFDKLAPITAMKSSNDARLGGLVVATESLSQDDSELLANVATRLEDNIRAIAQDLNVSLESYQLEAGTFAGLLATNPKAALASKLRPVASDAMVISPSVADGHMERGFSLEAYDERENRNAQLQSIVYNLMAVQQDKFGETFFPTIVINSNDAGIQVAVRLFYVYNDFKRSVTGSAANYGRVSILRAYADAGVLQNELTKAVPVLRTGGGADDNSDKFAPVAEVPARTEVLANAVSVTTTALKVDQRLDLLGLSQTNELLASGLSGPTDTLDTYITLQGAYLRITDGTDTDIIRLDTSAVPSALFTYAPQGNTRRMLLALDSDGIVLDADTKTTLGTTPQVLTELANHSVRLHLSVNGSVVLDKAELTVSRGSVGLNTLRNAAGELVTGAAFDALEAKLATAEVVYFDIEAYRANSNIRQRGRLLDRQTSLRVINVPYRSPFAVLAPTLTTSPNDTSALETLITTINAKKANDAVTALLRAYDKLKLYKSIPDANGDLPEISDIGFSYVKPVVFSESVVLPDSVDSLASHERAKDIRAALVEKLRFYANEMWRSCEGRAAASVLTGNADFRPTVIVGTDPVLYNYLMADGELRTLGEGFELVIVDTLDKRMKGKIAISFGVFDATRNSAINPLNSGNMLYSPELVSNLPVSRDGQVSNEIMTVPRYLHIWNLPVMTMLTVSGLPEVIGKVTINTNEV